MATTRRRKRPPGSKIADRHPDEPPPLESYPKVGRCGNIDPEESGAICNLPQYETPSGRTCSAGHGGASTVDPVSQTEGYQEVIRNAREIRGKPGLDFEVREGDRLTVLYNGVKLQIAPFSSVELDAAIYSRTLEPGDDAAEQFDRIHSYLKGKVLDEAREKLATFSEELHKARKNVDTGSAYD